MEAPEIGEKQAEQGRIEVREGGFSVVNPAQNDSDRGGSDPRHVAKAEGTCFLTVRAGATYAADSN